MYNILNAIMGFVAKIPYHTYLKYFDKEYNSAKSISETQVIKINVRFVAVDNDFERISLKWYSSTLNTGGEFDETDYRSIISDKVHKWISWNSRTGFTKNDFL